MKIEEISEFMETHKKRIPPFYRSKLKHYECIPLMSYFKIYEHNGDHSDLKRLQRFWFADKNTGYVINIKSRYGFKRCKYFYCSIFQNKRRAKRYIFGLKPDGSVELCAICTHISALHVSKHSKLTSRFLIMSRNFMYETVKEKGFIPNIYRIDKYIFALIGTKKYATRNKVAWNRVYYMAFKSKQQWRG